MSFDVASAYLTAMSDHYYPTTCLQALILVSIGDVAAQALEARGDESSRDLAVDPPEIDWQRTLRTGVLGVAISGLGDAMWLRYLEEPELFGPVLRAVDLFNVEHSFGLDADSLLVVVKTALDAFVWAPIANGLYLVLTPLSEGMDLASAFESLGDNFLPVMQSELSVIFPYNLLAFALIPPVVRPLATGMVSMFFSTYLSLVTHLKPKGQLVMEPAEETEARLTMAAATAEDAGTVVRRESHR
jgi:hypothetical protein